VATLRTGYRSVFTRYAVAWLYLVGVAAAQVTYALLPAPDRAALVHWASTSVHNLEHNPIGCLVASAFVPTGFEPAWPFLIALALFGANHLLGNWRTFLTCTAGHVIGTLVSEGIVAYRVAHGALPIADRYLIDVGPSYVVVAAIAVGLLHGGWLVRGAAVLDFALLIFVGQIFEGLGQLEVAAVGHLTAFVSGAVFGSVLLWRRRSKARALSGHAPAAVSMTSARSAALRTRGTGSSRRSATAGSAAPILYLATTLAAISRTRQCPSPKASMMASAADSSKACSSPRAPQTRRQY
jgi:hypothetical protein